MVEFPLCSEPCRSSPINGLPKGPEESVCQNYLSGHSVVAMKAFYSALQPPHLASNLRNSRLTTASIWKSEHRACRGNGQQKCCLEQVSKKMGKTWGLWRRTESLLRHCAGTGHAGTLWAAVWKPLF